MGSAADFLLEAAPVRREHSRKFRRPRWSDGMLRIVSVFTIAGCAAAAAATAADSAGAPHRRFAPDVATAWQVDHADGDDFLPPASGPGPVKYDPAHPFVPTVPGGPNQPTYRIADVTNPILKAWAADEMRKANQDVLNGEIP